MPAFRFATTTAAATAALALWAGAAQATVHTLSLTGTIANGSYFTQDFGTTHLDRWLLELQGLDSSNAITVDVGDTIEATITLDELFTVPGSVDITSFLFFLSGAGFPAGTQESNGTFSFFNGMTEVKTGGGGTSTSDQVATSVAFFPPDNGAFTFDSITSSFTIDAIGGPATLDSSRIGYALFSPRVAVPEPAAWALMILGFGGVGASLRRRRAFVPA